jgi:leader peptidase (prepilin peptidase) / N-methyltransferase
MDLSSLWTGGQGLTALAFGAAGLAWGVVADRISARWPAHEDGSIRAVDWRTVVVAVFAAVALAAVPVRFGDPAQRLLFGAFFAASVLLLATDLDQKLMPDVLTLPLIVLGVVALAWGGNTLVNRASPLLAVGAAIAVPALLWASSLPFGSEAFGGGDVKFLLGAGLLLGLVRLVLCVVSSAILGGVVIVALLALRRVSLRSYVPYGPFLIAGAVWAALLPATT